jgi:hypothetical protein
MCPHKRISAQAAMKHSTVATSGRGTPHTCMRDGAFKNKLCIVADFAELF